MRTTSLQALQAFLAGIPARHQRFAASLAWKAREQFMEARRVCGNYFARACQLDL